MSVTAADMGPEGAVNPAFERLRKHMDVPHDQQGQRWDALWEKGDFLPWDRGLPNPALSDSVQGRKDLFGAPTLSSGGTSRRKRALVPGCGRGYDVLLLASLGYDAYGLEVSENALKACEEIAKNEASDYMSQAANSEPGKYDFVLGDFYKNDWLRQRNLPEDGAFELIYDYTFFCAMPVSLRPAWAARMSELLAKKDGRLMCLEFPSAKPPKTSGPPFGVAPHAYLGHLQHPGKEVPYGDDGHPREDTYAPESVEGPALERVDHWQPKRTHKVGEGSDWISVWRHRG